MKDNEVRDFVFAFVLAFSLSMLLYVVVTR